MNAITIRGDWPVPFKNQASDTLKAELLDAAKLFTEVKSDSTRGMAFEALRNIKVLLRDVETSRVELRAPALKIGSQIDSIAKTFVKELKAESERLQGIIDAYTAEQVRIAEEAERKRLAELARIERERQRVEAEALAKAQAEERRLREEAATKKLNAFSAVQAELKISEVKEAAAVEVKAAQQVAVEAIKAAPVAPVIAKPVGMSIRKQKVFKVVDIHALYKAHPELCNLEVNTAEINQAIRAGMTECPGLIITEEVVTRCR